MKRTTANELSKKLKISKSRAIEAVLKANLVAEILKAVRRKGITHQHLADKAELSRSSVTGILSGSLQKVTLDRLIRLAFAAGLEAEIKFKKAA
jgi:predicted XRE-type DNA-binding protein